MLFWAETTSAAYRYASHSRGIAAVTCHGNEPTGAKGVGRGVNQARSALNSGTDRNLEPFLGIGAVRIGPLEISLRWA